MRYRSAILLFLMASTGSALALDMPARKPGLWELKMSFGNRNIPGQVMRQCTDATTDKLMNSNFGGAAQQACSKQNVTRSGGTITVDSLCSFAGATTRSHAVITGSFDSAYTMQVTTQRTGGPPLPGMAPNGESHVAIAAKWLGPCERGQRPGDVIMANGMKMNVLELQSRHPPAR